MRARSVPPCHGIAVESSLDRVSVGILVIPGDFLVSSFGQFRDLSFLFVYLGGLSAVLLNHTRQDVL